MVTKPTGKPRGRPPKPKLIAKPKLDRRGNPGLIRDPDRYFVAYAQFCIDFGVSAQRACEAVIALRDGRRMKVDEIGEREITAIRSRPGGWWRVDRQWDNAVRPHQRNALRKSQANVGLTQENWRKGNSFRVRAEGMTKRISRLMEKPAIDRNVQWLSGMTIILHYTIRGLGDDLRLLKAIAEKIGETLYFNRVALPILAARTWFRERGATIPEFFTEREVEELLRPNLRE